MNTHLNPIRGGRARWRRTITIASAIAFALIAASLWLALAGSEIPSTYRWQIEILKAQTLRDSGLVEQSKMHANIAMAEARSLGKDHPFYTITLRHLSDTNFYLRHFDAAKRYSLEELKILEPLGPDYQDRVPVLLRLTDIAIYNGNVAEAKKYIRDAKTLRDRSVFNPSLKAEINCRLALLAFYDGNKTESTSLRERAETEWIGEGRAARAATAMGEFGEELAVMSQSANRRMLPAIIATAEYWVNRGMNLTRKLQGTGGLHYINAVHRVATMYEKTGRVDQALAGHRQCMNIALKSKSMRDYEIVATIVTTGANLVKHGRLDEALPILEYAWSQARVLKEDPWSARESCLEQLVKAYRLERRWADAIKMDEELLVLLLANGKKGPANDVRREIERLKMHEVQSQ